MRACVWILLVTLVAPLAWAVEEDENGTGTPADLLRPNDHVANTAALELERSSPVPAGRLAPPALAEPTVAYVPARPDGLPFTAQAYGVADVETGQILFGQGLTRRMYPASLTKILTTLIALEAVDAKRVRLEDVAVISEEASKVPESGLYLRPGEHITLHDLLVGVMVRSANDCAFATAQFLSGGHVERFVAWMNQRAKELGCIDSHFMNPHGLHQGPHGEPIGDRHYTTGYDLLLITLEAWRHPFFRELCLMDGERVSWENVDPDPKKKHPPQRVVNNRNKLLHQYAECIGVKTGSTKQAGACLVSAARRGDREVLAVTLHAQGAENRWRESETLLRYGFDGFTRSSLLQAGQAVAQVTVRGGRERSVPVVATEAVTALVPVDDPAPRAKVQMDRSLSAPVVAGVPVGWATVTLPSGELRRVALVAKADVPAAGAEGGLAGWVLLALLGVLGYGALAEAHGRGGRLFAPRGRDYDPRRSRYAQRASGA